RQRKPIKLNNRRRYHVIRKPRPQMPAQAPHINRTPWRRHHIADKLRAPRPFTSPNHRSLRHTRMTTQRRLNLPRLNAKTANLNLMVRATHKLQNSITPPPRQVPAAVHPSPRSPKPVRNKALPSQPAAANIAATYPTAGYVKLPNNPNSYRLKPIIQNINTVIGQRTANRDMRTRLLALDTKSHGIDRRFRRTVKIGDRLEREASRNLSRKLYRQGLPTQDQMVQRRICRGTADDRVQVGRHAAHETHLFPDQSMPELRGRLPYRIADNHRRPSTDERQHRLLNRGVKSTRDDECRSEIVPHVEVLRQAQDFISEACMSGGDALVGSGGGGGIDDVGEVMPRERDRRRARGLLCKCRRLRIKLEPPRAGLPQPIPQRRAGDHKLRPGILQHERQALRRVARVERQIGATRLENADEPNQHLQRALEAKPDNRLRTNPKGAQMMRQLVGPRLQL